MTMPEGEPEPRRGRKLRLLAIDDEPRILRLMNAVLADAYDLAVANDGEQGLTLALTTHPDLILTDFNMPRMTGQELLRRLRQEPALEDVPVIVLTGHEDDQLRVDLLRNGAQDFLVKPFSVEELRVRIANLLRVKQARELLQEELQTRERDIGALVAEVAARRAALQTALETAQIARDQAEKASQAKTTFLALVSHELRTPLSVLRLTVDRWRGRSAAAGGAAAAEVQRMEAALDRLKSIVDGVIDYTTIQSGRIEPRLERTDLVALMAGLRVEFDPQIDAKGLQLEIEVDDAAKIVLIDPRIVRLIMSNLVGNAIKYTDQGVLQVRAVLLAAATPDPGAAGRAAGSLVLTVRDTGRGIDPLDSERIFEPFEHGERIENKSTPGVGLGLALVRDLVAVLGGRVTLASERGVGSTFTVSVPVS